VERSFAVPRKPGIPSLRRHKPSGQGVVTLSGKDHYCGRWPAEQQEPPPEVRAEYDRAVAEWLARGRTAAAPAPAPGSVPGNGEPAGLSVAELLATFMRHAEEHYRHPDGEPTSELRDFRNTLRPLNHAYGNSPVAEFGPLKLKAVRELMLKGYEHPKYGDQPPLARGVINQRIGRIVRVFKWGVAEELVPETTWRALTAVKGLEKGRSKARETEAVEPVAIATVEATLPHLTAHLQGAVRFQLLTGARPHEALGLSLAELDRTGPVWLYRPAKHKTVWRGKPRVVAIGPRAQTLLVEFIRIRCSLCGVEGRPPRIGCRDGALCGPCADRMDDAGVCGPFERCEVQPADACLFSPHEAKQEHYQDLRASRKSKVQPSQRCRKKKSPKRKPGARYGVSTYDRAIARACEAAGVPPWHPNQLRHTHATEVRRLYGLEAAQVSLGHSQANITEIYAERNQALAVKVASEIG
jgi:integrase